MLTMRRVDSLSLTGKFLRFFLPEVKNSYKRKYRLFQIEPSMECNLHCIMCPWSNILTKGAIMSLDTFESIAENFNNSMEIDLTGGGEPLLNPLLDYMVTRAKLSDCQVGFSTNATLLTHEKAKKLIDAGLDWIAFSIEGATAETYERIRKGGIFARVLDNMQYVAELKRSTGNNRPKTMIFFVMMKDNIHELPALIDLGYSLNIDLIVAKNLDVILKEDDDSRRIFKHKNEGDIDIISKDAVRKASIKSSEYNLPLRIYDLLPHEKIICEQDPLNTLFVSWDGYISPCINLSYIEDRYFGGNLHKFPPLRFGNISQETLDVIWEKKEYRDFRNIFCERIHIHKENILKFVASDFYNYKETEKLPFYPEGCQVCYYLYNV